MFMGINMKHLLQKYEPALITISWILAILLCLSYFGGERSEYKSRLMEECLADGKQEYECYALIKGRDCKATVSHD